MIIPFTYIEIPSKNCIETHDLLLKSPTYFGYMEVSWNGGTPKSSILIGFPVINHPAIGVPPFQETSISPRPDHGGYLARRACGASEACLVVWRKTSRPRQLEGLRRSLTQPFANGENMEKLIFERNMSASESCRTWGWIWGFQILRYTQYTPVIWDSLLWKIVLFGNPSIWIGHLP